MVSLANVNTLNPINKQHPLNLNRVAWWLGLPGRCGGTRLWDLFGLSHGTLNGIQTNHGTSGWRATARLGGFQDWLLDGTSGSTTSGIAVAQANNWTTISVGASFKIPSTPAASTRLFEKGANTEFALIFNQNGTTAGQISVGNNGSTIGTATTRVDDVKWHRALFTCSATYSMTLYIDGVSVVSGTGTAPSVKTANCFIGQYGGGSFIMSGEVDDVSIWTRQLTKLDAVQDFQISRAGYPGVLNRFDDWMYSQKNTTASFKPAWAMNSYSYN